MKYILRKIFYLDRKIEASSSNVVLYAMKMGLITVSIALTILVISFGIHYGIYKELPIGDGSTENDESLKSLLLYCCIIVTVVPVLENFLLLVFVNGTDLFINKPIVSVLVGITAIALLHSITMSYRAFYVFIPFVIYYFSYHRKRRSPEFAFLRSVLLHAFHNFYLSLFLLLLASQVGATD